MKSPLLVCSALIVPYLAHGQIIQSSSFYDPDFRARRPGVTSGLLSLTVNNNPYNATGSAGNTSWSHNAGGFVQARTNVTVLGTTVASLDAQLASYTQTTGDSLVFGRELTASATLLGLPVTDQGDALNSLVNSVVGASTIYNWSSSATVSGLAIAPDQLYQASFQVTSGSGLPVNLLSAATFGISTAGVTGASNESSQLLNLLNVVSIGNNSSTGNFTFVFKSASALSDLQFDFAATSGVGVSALGGTAPNQNVLTFTGFQVVAVPEASTASIVMLCGLVGLTRRRRL